MVSSLSRTIHRVQLLFSWALLAGTTSKVRTTYLAVPSGLGHDEPTDNHGGRTNTLKGLFISLYTRYTAVLNSVYSLIPSSLLKATGTTAGSPVVADKWVLRQTVYHEQYDR